MRIYNFSAGPSALPTDVLLDVQSELLDWQGMGLSAMEISHRSPQMIALHEQIEQDLRDLLNIPSDYAVILSSGGASAHSAFIPLNLLGQCDHADYIVTGAWSEKTYLEAGRYGKMRLAATGIKRDYQSIPDFDTWQLSQNAAYCHLASNETIHGVQFKTFPKTPSPLVADMSSDILSKPIDVTQFGMIYASAQKNMGPAGLTLVIIHRDLLGKAHPYTPTVFNYTVQAEAKSMANTPPTLNWYITSKILTQLKSIGGLSAVAAQNQQKAQCLYDYLDQSRLFINHVTPEQRSSITIPFFLKDDALTTEFLREAAARNLHGLKGHVLTGGIRACLYNAVPLEAVQALVNLMSDFEQYTLPLAI